MVFSTTIFAIILVGNYKKTSPNFWDMATLIHIFWEPWTINLRNGSIWLNSCLIWWSTIYLGCYFEEKLDFHPKNAMCWRVDINGHNWLIRIKWLHLNLLNSQIIHKFNQIDIFLKFVVQGSQKICVRVAISQKFGEVFYNFPPELLQN